MNIEEINICLLPSEKISQTCIELSQKISRKHAAHFTLDEEKYIPHISLYHLGIPSKNLDKLNNQISNIVKTTEPFPIYLKTFSDKKGYLSWDISISESLQNLQNTILDKINPLREGFQRKSVDKYQEDPMVSQEKIELIKEFGYPLVHSSFNPHITITRFKEYNLASDVVSNLSPITATFMFDSLHIGEIGENGTCPKIISTHDTTR